MPRLLANPLFGMPPTELVHTIVRRGGRCLLPVFALGRAQELLLILGPFAFSLSISLHLARPHSRTHSVFACADEYWEAHPELHKVPIYYASSLAKKCMTVYQTYINMMNENIRCLTCNNNTNNNNTNT
jgi:cleavage and polyadenylation specificity factor subunit 3